MEKRDLESLIKAIQQAQDRPRGLFSDKNDPLTLSDDERAVMDQARRYLETGKRVDNWTGIRLVAIYRKAYQ